MASKDEAKVKFTAETGEFNSAIKKAASEMTKLSSELKLAEQEMKAAGSSADGLAKKQQVLAKQAQATAQRVEALEGKLAKAKEIYGENSTEAQKLETQLNNARTAYSKIETQIEQTSQALEEQAAAAKKADSAMGRLESTIEGQEGDLKKLKAAYAQYNAEGKESSAAAKDVARQIEALSASLAENKKRFADAESAADQFDKSLDQVADSAKEAERAVEKSSGALGKIGKAAGVGLAGVATAAVGAAAGMMGLVESSQETLDQMGRLESAFEAVGSSSDVAYEAFDNFMGLTGDADLATETAQNMASLAAVGGDVAAWYDIAAGSMARYGEALPINSLLEASAESANVAAVTGALADAINWAGKSSEEWSASLSGNAGAQAAFNAAIAEGLPIEDAYTAALEAAGDATDRQALIQASLTDIYGETGKAYQEQQAALIEYREAQGVLTQMTAQLGEALMPVAAGVMTLTGDLVGSLLPGMRQVGEGIQLMGQDMEAGQAMFTEGITGMVTSALETISGLIPQLMQMGVGIIQGLVQGIVAAIPTLVEMLVEVLPQLVTSIMGVIMQLITSLTEMLPTVLPMIVQGITSMAVAFIEALPAFVEALTGVVMTLVEMLPTFVPLMIESAVTLFMALVDCLPQIIAALAEAVPVVIQTVLDLIPTFLPLMIDAAIQMFTGLVDCLPQIIEALVPAVGQVLTTVVEYIPTFIPMMLDAALQLFRGIMEALPTIIVEVLAGVAGLLGEIWNAITSFDLVGAASDMMGGIVDGIIGSIGSVIAAIGDVCSGIWNKVTSFFGINSPSRLMRDTFQWLPKGGALGIEDEADAPVKSVQDMGSDMLKAAQDSMSYIPVTATVQADTSALSVGASAEYGIQTAIDIQGTLTSTLESMVAAIEDLADRVISIEINGTQLARVTAGDTDRVNGARQALVRRGLSI